MQTFDCNPAQFASLRSQLIAEGAKVPDGNSGIIDSGMGFKVIYNWDGAGKIGVTVVDKTCWLPTTSQIMDQIQSHLSA